MLLYKCSGTYIRTLCSLPVHVCIHTSKIKIKTVSNLYAGKFTGAVFLCSQVFCPCSTTWWFLACTWNHVFRRKTELLYLHFKVHGFDWEVFIIICLSIYTWEIIRFDLYGKSGNFSGMINVNDLIIDIVLFVCNNCFGAHNYVCTNNKVQN